ncbi:31272_t:CDS:1, partial [Racocetra persica]
KPSELKEELRAYFSITDPKQLKDLRFYKRKLINHYNFTKIPLTYFALSSEREPLLLTYHELNSRVRHFFPIDPSLKETNIRNIAEILRKYYKFRSIPNDFF